jgi:sorbitol-6-phosphate 2-dehydrogenase
MTREEMIELLGNEIVDNIKFGAETADREFVLETAPELRSILGDGDSRKTIVNVPPFAVPAEKTVLRTDSRDGLEKEIRSFAEANGAKPEILAFPNAVFAAGDNIDDAENALVSLLGATTRNPTASKGRLKGKIALVTGGARGFGLGIAEELADNGASVALADLDHSGAEAAAEKLSKRLGRTAAFALKVDISNEDSVKAMFEEMAMAVGGVDILVANAGVLKAGPVASFEKRDWDFVTNINYTGYFLCAKHAAILMGRQNAAGGPWTDIVQVNSKSGLAGSKRNAAYAGSKFGTIGLTQSFALELIERQIKVNSVCPGNFFDGPLWSDSENGLFVQYLRSGKVPGAENIDDVRKHYENMIPMGRGCYPADVAKAIMYCVEQAYETGQAIPVTGGQVMLN